MFFTFDFFWNTFDHYNDSIKILRFRYPCWTLLAQQNFGGNFSTFKNFKSIRAKIGSNSKTELKEKIIFFIIFLCLIHF